MSEEKQPIGFLFGTIGYVKLDDINALIDNMTIEQSFYVLTQALEVANRSGIYTLQESEALSKSIRIITSKLTPND